MENLFEEKKYELVNTDCAYFGGIWGVVLSLADP